MSFLNKFVNTGSTSHAGLSSVQRALGSGMTIRDIRAAQQSQGFVFAEKASKYMQQAESAEAQLNTRENEAAAIQKRYQDQFASLQSQMNQQQQTYNSRLSEMTNTLQESNQRTKAALMAANQPGTKEAVLGVKAATSKDSPDIKKLTRAGMKGSFNRAGLRIKGLNVG